MTQRLSATNGANIVVIALIAFVLVAAAVVEIHAPRVAGTAYIGSTRPIPPRGCIGKVSRIDRGIVLAVIRQS